MHTYIDFDKKNNKKYRKFRVCYHVRISKYKTNFAKGFIPKWSEEDFVIKKGKNIMPWIHGYMLLVILKVTTFFETFMKKNCKKQIKNSLELKK